MGATVLTIEGAKAANIDVIENGRYTQAVHDTVVALRPGVVSFHFGLPSRALLDRVRSVGSWIISSATTVEEARWLESAGS